MTDAALGYPPDWVARRRTLGAAFIRSRADTLLNWLVAIWIFSGGIILFEPSLYELTFVLVVGVALLSGMRLHRATLPLLLIFIVFIPFAILATFQVRFNDPVASLIFAAVTIFLLFTSYFAANYVADAPRQRMRLIMRAYTVIAVIAAVIGILAYLRLLPGADFFLRYGRAKSLFKDPNVFGPFLILPALYALQKVLLGNRRQMLWGGVVFMIIFLGVFVSFSRGAWGHFALSTVLVFALAFFLVADVRAKIRMIVLATAGLVAMLVALAGLLSIPSVAILFGERASLTQTYDTGESGRFGRQGYAFDLALENPLGIGPLEFRNLRVAEEPHNTYVNVLHVYGWGGAMAYFALVILTLWKGIGGLLRPSVRLALIPLVGLYVPLVLEAAIIDTDHWRHYFLVVGLIWGVTAAPPGAFGPKGKDAPV